MVSRKEFFNSILVQQYICSLPKEAVPILYKSLMMSRLASHKHKFCYLVVLKSPIIAEIPCTNEACSAASCAEILISTAGSTQLIEGVKILDSVASWVGIKNVDFNLKQSLLMGIYSKESECLGTTTFKEWKENYQSHLGCYQWTHPPSEC